MWARTNPFIEMDPDDVEAMIVNLKGTLYTSVAGLRAFPGEGMRMMTVSFRPMNEASWG